MLSRVQIVWVVQVKYIGQIAQSSTCFYVH
jgi:hypothetical protein